MSVRPWLSSCWGIKTLRSFRTCPEEKFLHLGLQKLARLGLDRRQTVFIDEHGLMANPLAPRFLRHLLVNSLAESAGIGWTIKSGRFALQQDTLHEARHVQLSSL